MNRENIQIKSILKGCKKHKRDSQKFLYQHFYSYCMSICMRYAKTREDAVEIMNDGFMNVFTYIDKFDMNKPFTPWLRRIMVNCAIDHFKKNNSQQEMESINENIYMTVEDDELDSVSYEDLIVMIRKLPPAYGTVFNMRAIEGYKHEEVAQILGISVGTSKSNYAKAKNKLQEYLAEYFGVKQ